MQLLLKLFLAIIAGLFSHLGVFIHGERDEQAPLFLQIFLAFYTLLFISEFKHGLFNAMLNSTLISMVYGSTIWSSMIIYRLYFHRLASFPGPSMARVSKLWQIFQNSKSPNFLEIDRLRSQYGDFVRIGKPTYHTCLAQHRLSTLDESYLSIQRSGPNELAIFIPETLTALHGPNSKCKKSVWYASMRPEISIHTAREKNEHDKRRRIWDHGFNNAAIKTYDDRIQEYAHQLDETIAERQGQALDATTLFHFYAFDMMGSISYGKGFDLMKSGKHGSVMNMLRDGLSTIGLLIPTPWLFMTIIRVPYLSRKWRRMISWAAEQVDQRMESGTEKPDVMSWLIDAYRKSNSSGQERLWLNGDAFTLVISGSGTIALTLTMIFYHLAKYPQHAQKIRTELNDIQSFENTGKLQSLSHLNAVITETLRLYPGVPAGAPRDTPQEGLNISGRHIPGKVSVIAPCYSIGRLECCFEQSQDFVPERWTSRRGMVKNPNANKPFLLGRYGCVGKDLALTQLRVVVALLVSKYRISFPPRIGEEKQRVLKDMKDSFNLKPGRLDLCFQALR